MYLITINDQTFVSEKQPVVVDLIDQKVEISANTLFHVASVLWDHGERIQAIRIMSPVVGGLKEARDFCKRHFDPAPTEIPVFPLAA